MDVWLWVAYDKVSLVRVAPWLTRSSCLPRPFAASYKFAGLYALHVYTSAESA